MQGAFAVREWGMEILKAFVLWAYLCCYNIMALQWWQGLQRARPPSSLPGERTVASGGLTVSASPPGASFLCFPCKTKTRAETQAVLSLSLSPICQSGCQSGCLSTLWV